MCETLCNSAERNEIFSDLGSTLLSKVVNALNIAAESKVELCSLKWLDCLIRTPD